MMNEKNDYFRFPLALCPSEKSLTSTFGTWEAHGRLRRIKLFTEEDRPSGRPKKTVSSNAPNSKTRKRSIAEVDDIVVGGTEAEVGEDFNTWDLITNETNDKEGYDYEDEEEETILVNRQDDEEIMMCMIQEGFNDVFYHVFY
ncbi:hypothetical protein PRIPAC_96202 [Pristionchus pacificus]|uniref:Uncharacterized protein n=1 Tax=Pristionchus pacificus TaxID=54126 RepID=A0A2A6D1L1_PRIPA|nr:hypothetical protein PRIPAC_96202 [Pristionchus pacificus]|eukprot:PDM84191.1 hypothetical protein PRIPAC_33214 [Pristionchus pacificus]